ncbi:hypothetical protein SAMN02982996_02217 [Lonsdalea quercina]|uniref:Uncharacterized protein n=1 Tax=Lonsdalea quercina TaxID=71657 RepID=A0A1H4D948_9GAMM|nr:hypothetical protein SAMN02982996_02217 [Lonsdalea quercina]
MSTCSEENLLFLFPFISPPKYRLDNNSRLIHADPIFFQAGSITLFIFC